MPSYSCDAAGSARAVAAGCCEPAWLGSAGTVTRVTCRPGGCTGESGTVSLGPGWLDATLDKALFNATLRRVQRRE
jgi:hypothetical protein